MKTETRCGFCFKACKGHRLHSEYCSPACERAAKKYYVAHPLPTVEVQP